MGLRTYLRRPAREDEREFLALARASRALHGAWVKAPSTPRQFRTYLARMAQPGNHAFLVCRRGAGIVGVVNVTNIVLGAFRSGYLGYYAFLGRWRDHERWAIVSP